MCSRSPFFHALADLVARYVLHRHQARLAPLARHREAVGEVLAGLRAVVTTADGVAENVNAALRIACKRVGEADVRFGDLGVPVIEDCLRFAAAAGRGQRQCKRQRGARAGFTQLHRIVERGHGRSETPVFQIGAAQLCAVFRIAGIGQHGGFRQLDRLGHLAGLHRLLGLGRRDVRRSRSLAGATGKRGAGERGGDGKADHAVRIAVAVGHNRFPQIFRVVQRLWTCAASAASSGVLARKLSSASVTICWALAPWIVLARRSFR